jgi:acyl-CoA synthetase (AMP-forming)/AMP-acid ligase II
MLWQAFDSTRGHGRQLSVWSSGGFRDLSWEDWRRGAWMACAAAQAAGAGPGTPVACILTNTVEACLALPGIWLAGSHVLSLPLLARGMSLDAYAVQLRRILADSGAELVFAEARFGAALADRLPVPVGSFESLAGDWDSPAHRPPLSDPAPPGADDACYVQYSSGSTSDPRGCVLTTRAISAQLDMLAEALELDPAVEEGVSWLPLSHDMGLFGCLMLSFAKGMRLRLSSPERFLRSPRTWFDDCAAVGATITAGPNVGLELAARAAKAAPPAPFPMRKCVLGGERVEPGTLSRALAVLEPSGLTPSSLVPAYGLAEAVLAVTMTPVAAPPRTIAVDGEALAAGLLTAADEDDPSAVRLVSAGRPLAGVEVSIADHEPVGEICVSTPSLASGYLNDRDATAERFTADAVRTRDLGFLHDGELYVHGRIDDMLCLHGRNVWARDVETAVGAQTAIRPGSCVLVDVVEAGETCLVALAEPATDAPDGAALAREIRDVARTRCGVVIDSCLILPPGALPKTPSGKIQRYRARELARRYLPTASACTR